MAGERPAENEEQQQKGYISIGDTAQSYDKVYIFIIHHIEMQDAPAAVEY
jgi:hypothetical protein